MSQVLGLENPVVEAKKPPTIQLVVIKELKERGADKFHCFQRTLMAYLDETYKIFKDDGEISSTLWVMLKRVKAIVGVGDSPNQAMESFHKEYAEIIGKSKYKYEILMDDEQPNEVH